jgi:hypothetical protein
VVQQAHRRLSAEERGTGLRCSDARPARAWALTAALKTCPKAPSPQRDPERTQTLIADLLAQRQLIDRPTHRFAKSSRPLATDCAVIIEHGDASLPAASTRRMGEGSCGTSLMLVLSLPCSLKRNSLQWRVFATNWRQITRRERNSVAIGSVGSLRPARPFHSANRMTWRRATAWLRSQTGTRGFGLRMSCRKCNSG